MPLQGRSDQLGRIAWRVESREESREPRAESREPRAVPWNPVSPRNLGLPQNLSEPLETACADREACMQLARSADGIRTGSDKNRTARLQNSTEVES